MHNVRHVIVFLLVLLLGACATQETKDAGVVQHVLSIGRDGDREIVEPGATIRKRNPGAGFAYAKDHVFDDILDGIAAFAYDGDGRPRPIELVIFIHGGLNTETGSLRRALQTYKKVLAAGDNDKYPIFVNWRSGPIDTYTSHLARIRQGEISPTAKLSSPLYLMTDIANSLVNTPKSWLVTGLHMIETTADRPQKDAYLEEFRDGRHNVLFTGNSEHHRLRRSLLWLGGSPARLLTTPVTYTMAKPAWDIMLRRTNTPFYTPDDLDRCRRARCTGRENGNGALYQFLLALRPLTEQLGNAGAPVSITLVGHSMGAIIVNRIVSLDLDLPIKNIVHMASADSINNLLDRVVSYIQRKAPDVSFYSLSLHPENEDRETNLLATIPSGSLLVWIDTMYTTPETVLDRRSGRWENMARALALVPDDARPHMFFKIYGLNDAGGKADNDGIVSEPQRHGDFDRLRFWLDETWWPPTPPEQRFGRQ